MSRCKFCGAQTDWIWSQERGGYVKVDAEPVFVDLSGGEATFITDEGGILRGRLAPATGGHTENAHKTDCQNNRENDRKHSTCCVGQF